MQGIGPITDPTFLQTLKEVLSNPWWAAVLLGIGMFLHFLRDAAIERRLGSILEAQIKASHAAAKADLEQAVAMSHLADQVSSLETTVYRKVKEAVEEADSGT